MVAYAKEYIEVLELLRRHFGGYYDRFEDLWFDKKLKYKGTWRKAVVVAGEMLELGDDAPRLHIETGEEIAASDVDILIGVRGLGRQLVDGAKEAGLTNAIFAEDSDAAGRLLADEIKQGDVVLVKGSRGVRTEKVIEQLLYKFELENKKSAAN